MSYLQQILGNAQQNGGLTDDEFNSIFQQFMPQQQQQPNMGFAQQQPQQAQRPQSISQPIIPMQWGAGMNTAGLSKAPNGVQDDGSVNLMDRGRASIEHDTNMMSEQTKMLAEQDKELREDDSKLEGLMGMFGF